MDNNISYQTILAAKAGDPIAMEQVLRNYDSYITMCAQRTMTDTYGCGHGTERLSAKQTDDADHLQV